MRRTFCTALPSISTRRTITSSLSSAFFSAMTRTRSLLSFIREKLLPSSPACAGL